jgi:hypothetical protein
MTILPERSEVKEAYALAYAAFRLASSLDDPAFHQSLEDRGLKLLLAALDGDSAKQIHLVRDLEYLVGFGRDTGAIHPQTAEIMLAEIGKFAPAVPAVSSHIENKGPVRSPASVSAAELFPESPLPGSRHREEYPVREEAAPPVVLAMSERTPAAPADNFNFNVRKHRILERIRQSGNSGNSAIGCRLRDIQELIPDLSDRTLRYDLQRLVAEGAIERIGNGGPATFYRIQQYGNSGL